MSEQTFDVARATAADAAVVAALFNRYHQFYGIASNPGESAGFVRSRLERGESAVWLARTRDGEPAGFIQLYPSWSSLSCAPVWIVNDLFVVPAMRGRGIGEALLDVVRRHAETTGAAYLTLSTQLANTTARRLYERIGYTLDTEFVTYQLDLRTSRGARAKT